MQLQTIFNLAVIIYFILSSAHLIWQFTNLPIELDKVRTQILIALLVNIILLSLGLFLMIF
jgi:hypothetical protein